MGTAPCAIVAGPGLSCFGMILLILS